MRTQRTSACARGRQRTLTGFPPADQVSFQPGMTPSGLLHAAFGLTGGDVLLSLSEFPSLTYAAERATPRPCASSRRPGWRPTAAV